MAGRKPHQPTDADREKVQAMAGYGLPQEQIAKVMRISAPTLRKHYADELERGSAVANSLVAESLFKQARNGNTAAMIFWAKTRMGWRETMTLDHQSSDGSMSPKDNQGAFDELNRRLAGLAAADEEG